MRVVVSHFKNLLPELLRLSVEDSDFERHRYPAPVRFRVKVMSVFGQQTSDRVSDDDHDLLISERQVN